MLHLLPWLLGMHRPHAKEGLPGHDRSSQEKTSQLSTHYQRFEV